MEALWTLTDLVAEVGSRIAALPAPANGQVRAIPDERTIRYYGTIGLLDRPLEMRGRTALYGRKHLAQVVAIKRMQQVGKSLAEISALWATLDDATLARMSGVTLTAPRRSQFWKQAATVEQRVEIAPGLALAVQMPVDTALTPADVRALRTAAAPLIAELARRQSATNTGDAP